jgi:hypothetical protein
MELVDAVVAWTPPFWAAQTETGGQVRVGPLKHSNWKRAFTMTDGAVFTNWRGLPKLERELLMFVIFNQIVIRDGIDPKAAHNAFFEIDEYRRLIARDVHWAEDQPGGRANTA